MKRLCTDQEREVLYKNRKQIIKGKFGNASNERLGDFFVGLFLPFIVIIGIGYVLVITDKIEFVMQSSGFVSILLLTYVILFSIILKIISLIRHKKEQRRLKKRHDIMLNGATIVEVDMSGYFAYIEDDFCDENGKAIILEHPFSAGEVKPEDVGRRMLVLYDGDFGYRLVKLNEELRGLIPNSTYDYPLKENIHSYMRVPHPNMVNLEKTEHNLSEREKKFFDDFYEKSTRCDYLKRVKVCAFWMTIDIVFISVLLGVGKDGYPISKCVMFGAIGLVCIAVFFFLMNLLNKILTRRRANFVSVKKVVFVDQGTLNKVSRIRVFEWKQNQVQLGVYPNAGVPSNTAYGSILYKLVNAKGKIILLNANSVK